MKRRTPLRADPEKVREFRERAQAKAREAAKDRPSAALRRSTELTRGNGPAKAPRRSDRPQPIEGPLTPGAWRAEVWRLDGGRCVGCGEEVPLDADLWVWQAHHALPKQRLRRAGLHHLVWDPRNGVTLCKRCHERHESAISRIPGAKLPRRVFAFVLELGTWAPDALEVLHPQEPGREDQRR